MSNKKNYVPRNNADFNNWFRNMTQYVELKASGRPPEWDHILKREQDAMNATRGSDVRPYALTYFLPLSTAAFRSILVPMSITVLPQRTTGFSSCFSGTSATRAC